MADLIDRTARQVRPGTGQGPVHRLTSNRFTPASGRLYGTSCDKVLSGVSGAMLTTHEATCATCLNPGLSQRGHGPAVLQVPERIQELTEQAEEETRA